MPSHNKTAQIYAESDRNDSQNIRLQNYFPKAREEDVLRLKNDFRIKSLEIRAFNSGVVSFNPKIIHRSRPNLLNDLDAFREKYSHLSPSEWTDQQAQNFCLFGLWEDVDNYVCYWKLYLHKLLPLEDICILHFFRWHYPWKVYAVHAPSGKSFKNLYQENLEYFKTLTKV